MYPKWHFILGGVFTLVFWLVFNDTYWLHLVLIFLSSFLIDFDHYLAGVIKTGSFSLTKIVNYFKWFDQGQVKRPKREFFIFHTLESHLIVLASGFFWEGFFFVLIGMVFHTFTDLVHLYNKKDLENRHWFFIAWTIRKIKEK